MAALVVMGAAALLFQGDDALTGLPRWLRLSMFVGVSFSAVAMVMRHVT